MCKKTRAPDTEAALMLARTSVAAATSLCTTSFAGYPRPDHIDGDGLNNQRSNLRPATAGQNMMNRRKRWRATSRFVGVCWYPRREKWLARIYRDGTKHHLGDFSFEVEAALAYDAAAREMFGEYARPNFPDHQEAS